METGASSKNLLQRFAGDADISGHPPPPRPPPASNSGDDVELSLTLSLGGSFGSNKLVRSSSISSLPLLDSSIKEEEGENPQVRPTSQLYRTCSLPVPVPVPVPGAGDDEDYRKRKEMQSLKRLEAKRKRSEKRNVSKGEDLGSCLLSPGGRPRLPPLSQGSIGSVGSSSSNGGSMLGFDIAKLTNSAEAKNSVPNQTSHKAPAETNTPMKIERQSSGMNEMERSVMEEMPCVSTRGLGPNGQRIEGFLYKYRRGEEVRIMCVCHGKFWTPAEFVMHAGGGEVDHPLRHIVVNASPSPFL